LDSGRQPLGLFGTFVNAPERDERCVDDGGRVLARKKKKKFGEIFSLLHSGKWLESNQAERWASNGAPSLAA